VEAGQGLLRVDAWDELGRFVNGRDLRAVVVGPGGQRVELPVTQAGPGLYEAGFEADAPGDYVATVSDRTQGMDAPGPRTTGASRAYADEYRILATDRQLLARLASRTGGSLAPSLDAGQITDAVLARSARGSRAAAASASSSTSAAWPWLLAAALVLFVLDIAVRKVMLSGALRERLGPLLGGLRKLLPRARPGSTPEDVAVVIARAREEEKRKLRERISASAGAGKIDPDLAAYLYIARLRGKRTGESGKEQG
jgi:hypothetical protein